MHHHTAKPALQQQIQQSAALAQMAREPEQTLLVLDYDGSHAPFVPNADDATMYPGLREQIIALTKKGYTVAFSSGRELNDLQRIVGIPHIDLYAGSHGNHILIRGENRTYLPPDHVQRDLSSILQHEIIKEFKQSVSEAIPGFTFKTEWKPKYEQEEGKNSAPERAGSVVLHWRSYCEKNGIKGKDLKALEKQLFDNHLNPILQEYNKTIPKDYQFYYLLKAENHGMNADINQKFARNKGHAIDDFAMNRQVKANEPIYKHLLTVNDSKTDRHNIRKADFYREEYGTNTTNIIIEQASTPQWMLRRKAPDIVLRADRKHDPDLKLGGIPYLSAVYERLLR